MTYLPADSVGTRDPVGQLFGAALDGDQPSLEALRCLAEAPDDPVADWRQARRALRVLEERHLNSDDVNNQHPRVAAAAYADQLRARYREEESRRTARRSDVSPAGRRDAGAA